MRNSILIGQALEIPAPLKVGQVRMDANSKLGVIVGETPEAWLIMLGENMIQLVPREHQEQFERTVECLGEL